MDRVITVKVTQETLGMIARIHLVEMADGLVKQVINAEGEDIEGAIVELYECVRAFDHRRSFTCPVISPPNAISYPWLCNRDLCRGWDSESKSCLMIPKPEKKRSFSQWLRRKK